MLVFGSNRSTDVYAHAQIEDRSGKVADGGETKATVTYEIG
jgi:hypothetical protein